MQPTSFDADPPSLAAPRSQRRARAGFWLAALLLATAHVWLVNEFVPFRAVFTDTPLSGIDYDLHIGQVFRVVEALERWGRSWLYDVSLLAGQPEGTITDSGSKGWELWTFALHHYLGVPTAIAFNVFVLMVMLSGPLLIFAAARLFEFDRAGGLCAAAMTSALWFFDSHIHWVWFVGMVSWAGASCLSLVTLGLFYQFMKTQKPWLAAVCGLCLGTNLLIHPYTFFVLTPAMAAIYLRAWRTLELRIHAAVGGVALLAIAINAYWLHNALSHWHYILNSAYYAQASPRHLACDFFGVLCSGADTGVIGTRTGFRFLFFALGAAGLVAWHRRSDARTLPLAVGVGVLCAVAYLGGYVPGMQQTQPYRQITPAALFATLPAASFVQAALRELRSARLPFAVGALGLALLFALGQQLVSGQITYFLPRLLPDPDIHPDRTVSPLSKYGFFWQSGLPTHFPYTVPHDPALVEHGAEETIAWLERSVPKASRVLIDGTVLGERIAWRTRFEVLGGFFERNVDHVFANYFRTHEHDAASPEMLARYLRTFAVAAVVSNRPEFAQLPEYLQHAGTISARTVYVAKSRPSRVLEGSGEVNAESNRLSVRGSRPDLPVLLSYHWHEALRCRPDCKVERQRIDIDRVGLIRIPAPHPADFVIWNSYDMSATQR